MTRGAHGFAWQDFARNTFALWALLMLPLFATLESALLAQLEFGNQQWKHLLALPLPPATHVISKFITLLMLMLLAHAALAMMTLAAGAILSGAGVIALTGDLPLTWMLTRLALVSLGALGMLALQHWVALRFGNFTVAVAFGMTAALVSFFMAQSRHGHWLPQAWGAQPVAPHAQHIALCMAMSTGLCAVLLTLGTRDILRRLRH